MTKEITGKELLYTGKAKEIYLYDQAKVLVVFTDKATAFNGQKADVIESKGSLNCQISASLLAYLEEKGIPTHFIKMLDEQTQLVWKVEIIPVEVVVRNKATGSLLQRLPLEEGTAFTKPLVEFYYKSDELGDPLINDSHILAAGLATETEIEYLKETALEANRLLVQLLGNLGMDLIDMKLEFGRDSSGKLLLADEISPDTMRVWDKDTGRKLDKDRFRQDLGQVREGYEEILQRVKEGEQDVAGRI